MSRVILGSASPGRRGVLRAAGIDPLVVVSGVDEDAVLAALGHDPLPDAAVCALASAKAEQVAASLEVSVLADCVVIGCDSMLHLDGRLVGKPASASAARRQWELMAGRTGHLHTGHSLTRFRAGAAVFSQTRAASTTVRFGRPGANDLAAYIDSGEPLRVAGGFTLDGLGGWFIDGIDGDPSNVIGISLPLIRSMLEAAGLSIARLWAANPRP